MPLPKVMTPEYSTEIPSTKASVRYRPFLIKEEKILYMALESGQPADMITAIKQILRNCILTEEVAIDKLANFDIEYLFLQIRMRSVGEVVKLKMKHPGEDPECKHETDVEINLEDIKIKFDPEHTNVIDVKDDIGIKFRYPTIDEIDAIMSGTSLMDSSMDVLIKSIESIYDKDNVYEDFTKEELNEFLENLSNEDFKKLNKFFSTMPTLKHDVEWTCPECGKTEKITLQGLQSFFS